MVLARGCVLDMRNELLVNYFSISRPMKISEMSFDRGCILTRPINFNLNYRRAKLQ